MRAHAAATGKGRGRRQAEANGDAKNGEFFHVEGSLDHSIITQAFERRSPLKRNLSFSRPNPRRAYEWRERHCKESETWMPATPGAKTRFALWAGMTAVLWKQAGLLRGARHRAARCVDPVASSGMTARKRFCTAASVSGAPC